MWVKRMCEIPRVKRDISPLVQDVSKVILILERVLEVADAGKNPMEDGRKEIEECIRILRGHDARMYTTGVMTNASEDNSSRRGKVQSINPRRGKGEENVLREGKKAGQAPKDAGSEGA